MVDKRKIVLLSGKGLCDSIATLTMMPPRFYAVVENSSDQLETTKKMLTDTYGIKFDTNMHIQNFNKKYNNENIYVDAFESNKQNNQYDLVKEHPGSLVHSAEDAKAELSKIILERQNLNIKGDGRKY